MPRGRKKGSTKAQKEERLEKIGTMLAVPVPPERVVSVLAREWNLTTKQVWNLMEEYEQQALLQRRAHAPYMRDRLLRKAERLTATCVAEKKFAAAVQSIGNELKLTAALQEDDPEVDQLLYDLGPPPVDPTVAHVWVQRMLLINVFGVSRSKAIDQLTKYRLQADLLAKAGLVGDKAIVQEELRVVKEALAREQQKQLPEGGHGSVDAGPAGRDEKEPGPRRE